MRRSWQTHGTTFTSPTAAATTPPATWRTSSWAGGLKLFLHLLAAGARAVPMCCLHAYALLLGHALSLPISCLLADWPASAASLPLPLQAADRRLFGQQHGHCVSEPAERLPADPAAGPAQRHLQVGVKWGGMGRLQLLWGSDMLHSFHGNLQSSRSTAFTA